MFKAREFAAAEEIYQKILQMEPKNVDAINSLAYCIKFTAASSGGKPDESLYETLLGLYLQALSFDGEDIEANFNLGSLYLQFNKENDKALAAFQKCVSKDD